MGENFADQLLIQQVQGDAHRAGPAAVAAIDAAAGQVHGAHDVPLQVAQVVGRHRDPLRLVALDRAAAAVAQRAGGPAGIALEAAGEMLLPELPALFQAQGLVLLEFRFFARRSARDPGQPHGPRWPPGWPAGPLRRPRSTARASRSWSPTWFSAASCRTVRRVAGVATRAALPSLRTSGFRRYTARFCRQESSKTRSSAWRGSRTKIARAAPPLPRP